jgi:hypothetical protein
VLSYKRARNEHTTFIPSKEMFYKDFEASQEVSHDFNNADKFLDLELMGNGLLLLLFKL